jgi:hypothetical protein
LQPIGERCEPEIQEVADDIRLFLLLLLHRLLSLLQRLQSGPLPPVLVL